jgi:hypothetical protein
MYACILINLIDLNIFYRHKTTKGYSLELYFPLFTK